MAESSSKTPLSKEELRRLMKERTSSKKIDSPFAKYDNANQLICVLCKSHVKSEGSWTAHINGRQHQQALTSAKNPTASQVIPKQSKAVVLQEKVAKVPQNVPDVSNPLTTTAKRKNEESVLKSALKKSKVLDDDKSELFTRNSVLSQDVEMVDHSRKGDPTNLPSDFFDGTDSGLQTTTQSEPVAVKDCDMTGHNLPDNFFDKPTKNLKQKQEREKNAQAEQEWAKFQKVIQEESHKSAVVVENDDEETRKQKELDDIEEQLSRWEKIRLLEVKQEETKKKLLEEGTAAKPQVVSYHEMKTTGDEGSSDDDDLELLNWRKRKLW